MNCSKDEFHLHEKFEGQRLSGIWVLPIHSQLRIVCYSEDCCHKTKRLRSLARGGGWGVGCGGFAQVETRTTADVIRSFSLILRRART